MSISRGKDRRVLKATLVLGLVVFSYSAIMLERQSAASSTSIVTSVPIPAGPPNSISSVSVDPASNYTYIAGGSANDTPGAIYIFDNSNNSFVGSVSEGSGGSADIDTNTGLLYFANGANSSVGVINMTTNSVVGSIDVEGSPFGVAVDSTDGLVFVSTQGSPFSQSAIAVISEKSQNVTEYVPVNGTAGDVLYANGIVFEGSDATNTIEVAALNGTILGTIPDFTPATVDSLDNVLYGLDPASGNFSAVEAISGAQVTVPPLGAVGGMAFNPNTNRIYISEASGDLIVLDGVTNTALEDIVGVGDSQAVGVNTATDMVYAADQTSRMLTVLYDSPVATSTSQTIITSTSTAVQTTTRTHTSTVTTTTGVTTTSTSLTRSTSTSILSTTKTKTKTSSVTTTAVQTISSTVFATATATATATKTAPFGSATSSSATYLATTSYGSTVRSSGASVQSSSDSEASQNSAANQIMNLDLASVAAAVAAGAGGAIIFIRKRI
jgi:YVTN family beta-propeller protein